MKATAQIHQGKVGIPDPKYPFPYKHDYYTTSDGFRKDLYDKKFSDALEHWTEFEDQFKVLGYIYPADKTTKIIDGLYSVELPPFERVEQYRRITKGTDEWIDLTFEKIVHPDYEYRTIIRFVKESEPKLDKWVLKKLWKKASGIIEFQKLCADEIKTMKDSAPIPDQPKKDKQQEQAVIPKSHWTPDNSKIYISPSKEMVYIHTDGEWKLFLRSDVYNVMPKSHPTVAEPVSEEEQEKLFDIAYHKFLASKNWKQAREKLMKEFILTRRTKQ